MGLGNLYRAIIGIFFPKSSMNYRVSKNVEEILYPDKTKTEPEKDSKTSNLERLKPNPFRRWRHDL